VMSAVRCGDCPVISRSSQSWLNTMYRSRRRRETSVGTVFSLYQRTGSALTSIYLGVV
jgi:hypothetical protein